MLSRILIDTGPLVALIAKDDQYYHLCRKQLKQINPPFLTCWPVITEAAWLLKGRPDKIQTLLKSIGSFIEIATLGNEAAPWIASFLHDYEDIRPQLADACLVYLAERENIDTVFTLDRRDFSIYRYKRNQKMNLIPAL